MKFVKFSIYDMDLSIVLVSLTSMTYFSMIQFTIWILPNFIKNCVIFFLVVDLRSKKCEILNLRSGSQYSVGQFDKYEILFNDSIYDLDSTQFHQKSCFFSWSSIYDMKNVKFSIYDLDSTQFHQKSCNFFLGRRFTI